MTSTCVRSCQLTKFVSRKSNPQYRSAIGVLIALLFASSTVVNAKENETAVNENVAPLFASDSALAVTIEAPLTTLMQERPDEEYLNGTFSFTGTDGTKRTIDLKLRTRGNYRRQKDHCNFAPIRLNFRKSQLADTIFAGQDKLKMVTHCQNNNHYYEQLVLREFLAYRILNAMTNKSFGVRLLRITYVDTEGAKAMTNFGFVIEDDDHVADRNGMKVVKTSDTTSDNLDRRQQNLINVFQYMIGNTEYSLFKAEPDKECCHNADLMAATDSGPFTPLAYDFDFAGLVNAPYAEPNPRYNLLSVRQRLYKGACRNNDLLPDTLRHIQDRKNVVYGIVDSLPMLSLRSKRDVIRYLDSFYDRISTPKSVTKSFVKKCKSGTR